MKNEIFIILLLGLFLISFASATDFVYGNITNSSSQLALASADASGQESGMLIKTNASSNVSYVYFKTATISNVTIKELNGTIKYYSTICDAGRCDFTTKNAILEANHYYYVVTGITKSTNNYYTGSSPSYDTGNKYINYISGVQVDVNYTTYGWNIKNITTNSTTYDSEEDTTPPIYSQVSINNTYAGNLTNFSINISDETSLEPNGQYIFSTNNTGEWVNESEINFTGTTWETISIAKVLNDTLYMVIGYMWYFWDNIGNTNSTIQYIINITQQPTTYHGIDFNVTSVSSLPSDDPSGQESGIQIKTNASVNVTTIYFASGVNTVNGSLIYELNGTIKYQTDICSGLMCNYSTKNAVLEANHYYNVVTTTSDAGNNKYVSSPSFDTGNPYLNYIQGVQVGGNYTGFAWNIYNITIYNLTTGEPPPEEPPPEGNGEITFINPLNHTIVYSVEDTNVTIDTNGTFICKYSLNPNFSYDLSGTLMGTNGTRHWFLLPNNYSVTNPTNVSLNFNYSDGDYVAKLTSGVVIEVNSTPINVSKAYISDETIGIINCSIRDMQDVILYNGSIAGSSCLFTNAILLPNSKYRIVVGANSNGWETTPSFPTGNQYFNYINGTQGGEDFSGFVWSITNITLTELSDTSEYKIYYDCNNSDVSGLHNFKISSKIVNNTFAGYGNSVMWGLTTGADENTRMTAYVSNQLNSSEYWGITQDNQGVNAGCLTDYNSAQCNLASPDLITAYRDLLIAHNPLFAYLSPNVNDVKVPVPISKYRGDLDIILDDVKANLTNTTFFVGTLQPGTDSQYDNANSYAYNIQVRESAILHEIPLLEWAYISNTNSSYYYDNIHLNLVGQTAWGVAVTNFINNNITNPYTPDNWDFYYQCNDAVTLLNRTIQMATSDCARTESKDWVVIQNIMNGSFYVLRADEPISYKINWELNPTSYYNITFSNGTESTYPTDEDGNLTINIGSTNDLLVNYTYYDEVGLDSSNCSVYFNATSPLTYPDYFIAYTDCTSAYHLYLNGTEISNGTIVNGGVTAYNISVQRIDTANYTNTYDEDEFNININTEVCNVLFNETSPLAYLKQFTVYTNCSSNVNLYRNGTSILNNSNQNLGTGAYNFSFLRIDTVNYSNISNEAEFTVYIPITTTGESYSTSTYETNNETFYINISTITGVNSISAFLVYNGTYYPGVASCSGSDCQIYREIDIPLLSNKSLSSENKSFYWDISLLGVFGSSTNTTEIHNQNVSNIIFQNCESGFNTLNFSIYNESDSSLLNSTFKATFYYWLGTGTVKDTYNFSGFGNSSYLFCFNYNITYKTSSDIVINSSTDERDYEYAEESHSSSSNSQSIYIPDDSLAENIIIEVKNQGLVPLANIVVNISRFYPDTNEYKLVENKITDVFGQINAKLVKNDVKYVFNFYDLSGNLLYTSGKVTIICRSTICVVPFIIQESSDYLERYSNLILYQYSLSFDNSTNTFTFSWSDQRNENARERLEVVRYKFNESTVVCNTTSTDIVSSLTCDVGDDSASYTAQVFRLVPGENEIRISYLQIIVGDYSSTFGVEGLFWVFILLMICVGIGVYDPKVGAILYGVGFIFMGILKIIYMPLPVFFANTIIVILFVWAVKT